MYASVSSIGQLRQSFQTAVANVFKSESLFKVNSSGYICRYSSNLTVLSPVAQHHLYQGCGSKDTFGVRSLGTNSSTIARNRNRGKNTAVRENTKLTEVITIYEKLTKSKQREEDAIFRFSMSDQGGTKAPSDAGINAEESATVLDFAKFRDIQSQNYMYFSAKTGLIQANTLNTLQWKKSADTSLSDPMHFILNSKQSCLCIVNPTESDLAFIGTHLNVHDLTLRDIREQNTEEKVEVFKNYTFISFKVYLEAGENRTDLLPRGKKEDLNILMFPDSEMAIILHYGAPWTGFKDMMGFLNLLCTYGDSFLTPDWVFFSIIIELAQDAKFVVKQLESKILHLKVANSDSTVHKPAQVVTDISANTDLSEILTKNFENEFEIYRINRFIKPKIRVLKELQVKGTSRISPKVLNLLSDTSKDFEELGEALGHFNHILERSQDTCLTLANVRQSQEANEMGRMMKRISEVAFLFLPLQAIAGLLGMNVKCPLQDWDSTVPFWGIIATSSCLVIILYRISQAANKKIPSAISRKPNNSGSK